MRSTSPLTPFAASCVLLLGLQACQQPDQTLPFEIDPEVGQSTTVTTNGGFVSLPPDFFMEFQDGTVTSQQAVTVVRRTDPFPNDAGRVIPGRAFDVGPRGVTLPGAPARVQIAVPPHLLQPGEELSLQVALIRDDDSIVTDVTSYDLSNGFLTAEVDELGPVAAVVSNSTLPVGDVAAKPDLTGGAIAMAGAVPSSAAPAPIYPDGVEFTADCSPGDRSCLTSGIVKLYVDDTVRDRLGDELVLSNTSAEARIEFFSFNAGVPDSASAYILVEGELRARVNSVVSGRLLDDDVALWTGLGSDPRAADPTAVTLNGGEMTFELTSVASPAVIEYGVTGIGTSDLLTVRLSGVLDFNTVGGGTIQGEVVADVRLRR